MGSGYNSAAHIVEQHRYTVGRIDTSHDTFAVSDNCIHTVQTLYLCLL